MGHFLVPLPLQADNLQHFPDILLRYVPESLDDTQIFLPGEMPVITGALDKAPHLPQHRQAVSSVHALSQHPDIPRRGAHQAQEHFQGSGFPRPVGAQKAVYAALRYSEI